MVNREKGSGARVLIDEHLRLAGISPHDVNGYDTEESNHIGVASKVVSGQADVGVGIEKAARLVDVDFIPIMKEHYDLVIMKTPQNDSISSSYCKIFYNQILSKARSKPLAAMIYPEQGKLFTKLLNRNPYIEINAICMRTASSPHYQHLTQPFSRMVLHPKLFSFIHIMRHNNERNFPHLMEPQQFILALNSCFTIQCRQWLIQQ